MPPQDKSKPVLDRYNAVMETTSGQKSYRMLSQFAHDFIRDEQEHNQFMNECIDAALEACGHPFAIYRGSILRATMIADSISKFVTEALDTYLQAFGV